mmetsp:Transcript_6944/g.17270  ORF Transcript_6944/g.17270 Transcript_6944/m.17270 type:complete len:116 (-) Transcript_6944:432-779(-)
MKSGYTRTENFKGMDTNGLLTLAKDRVCCWEAQRVMAAADLAKHPRSLPSAQVHRAIILRSTSLAGSKVVKKAYRALIAKLHPDKLGSSEYSELDRNNANAAAAAVNAANTFLMG